MKEYWSKRARDLVPYTPGEQPRQRNWIKLNTNENPYPPSQKALAAIRAAAGETLRRYPDPECTSLREALAATFDLKPAQVFVGNGSDEVLALCFQAFFDPERTILFPDVTYSFYPVFADLYGLSYREVPLDERFGLPLESFVGDNGGVVIANPNAPTGRAVSLCDIRTLLEGNPESVVIVDEAYVDFGAQSAVPLIDSYPNLVVVQTMSKSRALAGLRVGFALGNENLIAALNSVKNSFNSYTLDRLALAGAEGALRDGDYLRAITMKISSTRDWAADRLKRMGFEVSDSAANFLFISHPDIPAKVLLDGLREWGILVRWWDKPRISNYLRITVGTDQEMEALCQALTQMIEGA
ncbi:histidinol-phosphate transaminase [Pseudoflavonifractor phocaeensis]|uniref:histidinol-phosphate transaminase n=1 Tax=Pseudoflavonifractor phocaeensis TaxID=1870988 RepID=UPI00195E981D|nr:histidinol-phosphate transaminase [Pseudoflavonifractor phocaeensis]MBM6722930.1 histidinol-phosphate transaminase [Pseudoflavonifractor phocaeensis]